MLAIKSYSKKHTIINTIYRQFSQSNRTIVMSPIFYVNAKPHIGHLYTAVLCDAVTRYHKFKGEEVFFGIGTDEHGIKIQKRAIEDGKDPQKFCDDISANFKQLFKLADVNYSKFIRTTDSDHEKAVHSFWNILQQNGYIKEGKHEGYYSINEESFIAEKDLIKNEDGNLVTEAGEKVELITEKNYVFHIDEQIREKLREWAKQTNPDSVRPDAIRNKILDEIENKKAEISVSRPTERVYWGIKVPNDPSQTIYVWLDALTNYVTLLGYPDKFNENEIKNMVHIIGKDIAKFHCVYWPSFLLAAGLPLPKQVLNHGHWLRNKMKMSKSLGNVVDPFELIKKFGVNSVRSYFLSEGPQFKDSNFEQENLKTHHNTFICDQYVNLLFRITGKKILKKRNNQIGPLTQEQINMIDSKIIEEAKQCLAKVQIHYQQYDFIQAFGEIKQIVYLANLNLSNEQFWAITDDKKLDAILYITFEILRVSSILLQPFIPTLSSQILDFLSIPKQNRSIADCQFQLNEQTKIIFDLDMKKQIFVPKIEDEKLSEQSQQ